MPIKQKSSIPVTALGLSRRDHGAIASAIAPLMVLFINVASPRPALAQNGKDKKLERCAPMAPQRASLALDGDGLPPMLTFATSIPVTAEQIWLSRVGSPMPSGSVFEKYLGHCRSHKMRHSLAYSRS